MKGWLWSRWGGSECKGGARICCTSLVLRIWKMVERLHPAVPEFRSSPVGTGKGMEGQERRAQLLLVYFTPWVLDESMVLVGVPLAGELPGEQEEGKKSWQGGLERCCDRGFRSEEAIQTMKNFWLTYFCKYSKEGVGEHSEAEEDVALEPRGTQKGMREAL